MAISSQWWTLIENLIDRERDDLGVYEVIDSTGEVVSTGSSSDLQRSYAVPHRGVRESSLTMRPVTGCRTPFLMHLPLLEQIGVS